MWPTLLYAALAIAICGWIFTSFRQRQKVHALERSKEEIQVEETLVFDFLHGLGEAFRETIKPHDLHRAATTPAALEGFLRMHSVAPGEGLIGTVWQTTQPVSLTDVRDVPELARLRETPLGTASLMATALLYGKQNMGVLAVGNGPMGAPFTPSDFCRLQIDRRAIRLRPLQRH